MTTLIVKLRDNVKKWEGITLHDKNGNLVTLLRGSETESVECNESDAKSYIANYGHLLETVTQDDLNKQVSEIAAFLKKKFPKEFGKGVDVEEEQSDDKKKSDKADEKKDETEWTGDDKKTDEDKKDETTKDDKKTDAKKS